MFLITELLNLYLVPFVKLFLKSWCRVNKWSRKTIIRITSWTDRALKRNEPGGLDEWDVGEADERVDVVVDGTHSSVGCSQRRLFGLNTSPAAHFIINARSLLHSTYESEHATPKTPFFTIVQSMGPANRNFQYHCKLREDDHPGYPQL